MIGVYKYGGVGLSLPQGYGGREDGVQECFVDCLSFEAVGEASLHKLPHPRADRDAEAEHGGRHWVNVAWNTNTQT